MIFQNFGFNQNYPVAATPAATQYVYLCGYNFYKWNGTQLGTNSGGGIAKIGLDGVLDTTWTTNANPSTSQVRFFAPQQGNMYADFRVGSTRTFRKLDTTGTSVGSVTTTGGSIWGMSTLEGNDFVMITGDTTISYGGTTVKGVGKVKEDLTLDSTFITNTTGANGANAFVNGSSVSSNRIGVLGNFTTWNGLSAYDRFVVLNYDGSRDTGFSRTGNFNGNCYGAVFINNRWIVGGLFTTYNGVTQNRIIAFNTDGTVDTTFTTNIGSGFNAGVYGIYPYSSTQFVATGVFTTLNGVTQNRIALINSDGTIPSQPFGTGLNNGAAIVGVDASGKYYLTCSPPITTYNTSNSANNFFALNTDGTINTSFTTGNGMQTTTNTVSDAGSMYVR